MMNTSSNISQNGQHCGTNANSDVSTELLVKIIFITLLGVFGFCSNVLIIIFAVKYTIRKNLHHLIINIAIADALVIIVDLYYILPDLLEYSIYNGLPRGIFADGLCKVSEFLRHTSVLSTISSLLIISVERFRATKLLVHKTPSSWKKRAAALAFLWIFPMALSAYNLILLRIVKVDNIYQCIYWQAHSDAPYFGLQTIFSLVLFFVIYILSFLTLRRISTPLAIEESLSSEQRKLRKRRIIGAVRMVMSSLFMYSCCYIPGIILLILKNVLQIVNNSTCYLQTLEYIIWYFLPILNSCLGPWICIVFLADFREVAMRFLLCRKNRIETINIQPTRRTSTQ